MLRRGQAGFTLLELVMVIVIIGILGAVAIRSADLALDRNRYFSTLDEMERLGYGIAGNPDLVSAGTRTDFGYVGDMGSLPNSLDDLLTDQGGTWAGPYIVNPVEEDPDAFKTDGWGQTYSYPAGGSRIKISSAGGGDAITYQFAPSEVSLTSNTISGTITDWNGANPIASDLSNIIVSVHYPSGGAMTSASANPSAGGVFSIPGIPIGIRRVVATHSVLADSCVKLVTVTPGANVNVDLRFNATLPGTDSGGGGGSGSLEYVAGSAFTFGGNDRHVRFQVRNPSADPVSVTSLVADYTTSPTAYYSSVDWEGVEVWSDTPRHGSGDETTFVEQQVDGGATATVEIKNFRNTISGGGGFVDMSATQFQITFSDDSVIDFTTP